MNWNRSSFTAYPRKHKEDAPCSPNAHVATHSEMELQQFHWIPKNTRNRDPKIMIPCFVCVLLACGVITCKFPLGSQVPGFRWYPGVRSSCLPEKRRLRWVFVGVRGYPLGLVVKSLANDRVSSTPWVFIGIRGYPFLLPPQACKSYLRKLRWVFVGVRGGPLVLVVKSLANDRVSFL